jgi:ATP-dependent Clp protease ATP-binding subunit ClpB
VGKTELARTLAEFLFDDEKSMIRIDMSEYMERHTVAKLIGAPPGYIGYDEGGQLTEAVRRKPYSVILLDEIEKAHPDVFNILLQILDEGRLTDSRGRTVNFKNTVVIMTSNLGSEHILRHVENDESYEEMKKLVVGILRQSFRPEFLNRIDETVVFHSLTKGNIVDIAKQQLSYLANRIRDRGITVHFEEKAVSFLADHGYDVHYGARPLKRTVQNLVETPLAKEIVQGTFREGDTISVQAVGDHLTFKKQ